ncbi:hypothetical protein CDD83_10517 [Cordyceps sp. RAO-2017]|nr:hypothetical protein CDD83_10517 [Cordyceps sp. RAO-2017]
MKFLAKSFILCLAATELATASSAHRITEEYERGIAQFTVAIREIDAGFTTWHGDIQRLYPLWHNYFQSVAHLTHETLPYAEPLEREEDIRRLVPGIKRAVDAAEAITQTYKLNLALIERKKLCDDFLKIALKILFTEIEFFEAFLAKIPDCRLGRGLAPYKLTIDKIVRELVQVFAPGNCTDSGSRGHHY